MTERQLRGGGVVLVSVLVAAFVAGSLWRGGAVAPSAPALEPVVPASGHAGAASADDEPVRHIEVPPGWRAEQIADALDGLGIANGRRFLALVRERSLEGFLFPGVYDVGRGFSAESLLAAMTKRFRAELTPALRRRAAGLGLTIRQAVTLASIVQREMVMASEAPVIAGVFHNRLRVGMNLGSDPTVIYALDSRDRGLVRWWRRRLSRANVRYPSPYNTYHVAGLPPAPIASPSREALVAALFPARVEYRFFVARGNGTHDFSVTGAEHVAKVARYAGGAPRPAPPAGELQRLVERIMEPVRGHVGVVVRNLRTGEQALLNAEEYFTAASLYKLAVMWKAFEERERGRLAFDAVLPIPERAAEEDYEAVRERLGRAPTVRKAIEEMIVVSSNAAGVTLLRKLGRGGIDRLLRRHGLRSTSLSSARLVTTPADVAALLELLARGRAVSPQASREMLAVLHRQEINDRLPRYLPPRALFAHKTGTLDFPSHDAGILYTSAGPVVIAALTEDVWNRVAATESIARLGRVVHDYYESYTPLARRLAANGNSACRESPFAPRTRGPLSGRAIVLDPAYGGRSAGAVVRVGVRTLREKDVVLDVGLRLRDRLAALGATVHMTRCRDAFRSLMARAALANGAGADLVVSIHLNRSRDRAKDGSEVDYFLPDGKVAARHLLGTFTKPALWETMSFAAVGPSLPNRGTRLLPTDLLVHGLAPTALTRAVYVTNPTEAALLLRSAGAPGSRRAEIVEGHVRGILANFGAGKAERGARRTRFEQRRLVAGAEVRVAVTGEVPAGARVPELVARAQGVVVVGALAGGLTVPWDAARLRRAGVTVVAAPDGGDALDAAGLLQTGRRGQVARQLVRGARVAVVEPLPSRRGATALVRKAEAWADVVVASLRGPLEPGLARALVDAGADLVVGHGRLGDLEWHRGRLIAYGLGVFGDATLEVALAADGSWRRGRIVGAEPALAALRARALGVRVAPDGAVRAP